MSVSERPWRLAFVSAPGGSAFMEEILSSVAAAARELGVEALTHQGYLSEVAEPGTRFVVIPHEYFALAPDEPEHLYRAAVGFGVEHPGTATFAAALNGARKLGANTQISQAAVQVAASAGIHCEYFRLGYVPSWDRWQGRDTERPVDVVFLGTADPRRLGLLADMADDLAGLNCEFLIPPHEPMTRPRPDFLQAEAKWDLLARSKVLINLHREDKTDFEWVRCLEAMVNGCVVITEPSTELEPLVPGRHVLTATPDRLGAVVRAVVTDVHYRDTIARNAYDLCRDELDVRRSTEGLIALARALPAGHPPVARRLAKKSVQLDPDNAPMAVWIPELEGRVSSGVPAPDWLRRDLIELDDLRRTAAQRRVTVARRAARRPSVDVLCVGRPEDGPLALTADSLRDHGEDVALHFARVPAAVHEAPDGLRVDTWFTADRLLGRGVVRNELLKHASADLVCVLDGGDALRPGMLDRMVARFQEQPELDIVFAMAKLGNARMINVLVPELRRLKERSYLTRGYVVRREWLDCIGQFSEEPQDENCVDAKFWLAGSERGARVELLRTIGFALWPTERRADRPDLALARPASV